MFSTEITSKPSLVIIMSCVKVRLPALKCGAKAQPIFDKENSVDFRLWSLTLGFNLKQGPADSEYIMCWFLPALSEDLRCISV